VPEAGLVGEVDEVQSWGTVLIDDRFARADDSDTAVTISWASSANTKMKFFSSMSWTCWNRIWRCM